MSAAPIIGGNGRPRPTHCSQGHEYTEENTYYKPNGARNCQICRRRRRRTTPPVERPLTAPDPDGLWQLYADMCRLAIEDYETLPVGCRDHQTAAAWLAGTRLLDDSGNVDRHGYARKVKV